MFILRLFTPLSWQRSNHGLLCRDSSQASPVFYRQVPYNTVNPLRVNFAR